MTQAIDPIKLKAAAEHLEWVLKQYPGNEDVQGLMHGLLPLIEDAKEGRVREPVDRMDIPYAYRFSDGDYAAYANPSVEDAYYEFSAQMRGGRDEQEKQLIAKMEAMRQARKAHEGQS